MANYKLYYFDFGGRAEFIRIMFHYAGVPFEDVRFSFQEWGQNWKHKMPFGKVPVLEIDGVMLPDSRAIGSYLGKKFDLAGKDDLEFAQIEALLSFFNDFLNEIHTWFSAALGFGQGDKDKLYKEVFEPAAAKALPIFEKHIKEAGNGFYFKSGLTWADFYLSKFWQTMDRLIPDFFDKHPILKENSDKVNALPQIQKYLKERGDINKMP
uniref:glutathione transferase n=1 Tax=Acrobeloides nanus TaxID=290746 RepID=A0A914C9B5_9BILA